MKEKTSRTAPSRRHQLVKVGKSGIGIASRPRKPASSAARRASLLLPSPASNAFPIVAIGASAGGLEAIDEFLKHVPPQSGICFVIIQHLDPERPSIMAELLQRFTAMKVVEAKDRMKVRPETVIVLPPNREMTIKSRILRLVKPSEPRGRRLPIDCFFRALAMDQQEAAIGVILSGMGADGSHGLKIIKEYAGAIFVQDPAGAGFDAMPRSAIETGFVDAVAPAGELPKKILDYLHHVPNRGVTSAPAAADEQAARSSLEKILVLLKIRVGHDFSLYKMASVRRRIERRMGLVQVKGIPDYIRLLKEDPREIELLAKDLLIGVTSFFRDPEVWEELKKKAIPPLLAGRRGHAAAPIRAWVAGCSTGEEAYTLAMIVKEAMEKSGSSRGMMLQIFATDLDANAIEKARAGLYPAAIEADLSAVRLKRFFTREEKGYRVNQEIREAVTFAPHNLVSDPPFSRLDILTCRNLLIYFSLELQKKILPVFHYALAPGGVMVLGSSESIGQHTDLFAPLSASNRLYRRGKGPVRREIEFPSSFSAARPLLGTKPAAPKGKAAKTKARAKVTITVEDFQAAEEELKSTNEELQSANEELQSTNEELTTSKEEMQSINEELQTVNQELRAKGVELAETNSDLQNFMNSADAATIFLDIDLKIRRFTARATELMKIIPGDVGRPITDLASKLDYPELAHDAQEVLRTLHGIEKTVTTRDGRWFMSRIVPYRTPTNVIAGVVLNFTEVTDFKQAEASLRKSSQENILQAELLRQAPVIAAFHDKDQNIVWANKAYEEATGLSLHDIAGKKCYSVWNLSGPCQGCPVLTAIATGNPCDAVLTPQNQEHWPESQGYWLSKASPIRDHEGSIIGAIEIAIDITDRKLAEEEHKKLQAQLLQSQKMESVGRLAGGVAHDFNNLLTVVKSNLSMIKGEHCDECPHAELLNEIGEATERATELTGRLLAFSRQNIDKIRVCDLTELVLELRRMLTRVIGEDIQVEIATSGHSILCQIDRGLFEQVIVNLAVNARDAMPRGGVFRLTTKIVPHDGVLEVAARDGMVARISASDTGGGIESENLARIFDPFFTTKEVGKGTGLGLAMAYGVVKQHGGEIQVRSEVGQGTTFEIHLPLCEETAVEPASEPTPAQAASGVAPLAAATILLVEDEASVRRVTKRALEKIGHRVIEAADPEKALARVNDPALEFDLVLSDIVMPGMNGLDLMTRIKEIRPGMKSLFMSGYAEEEILSRISTDSSIEYLAKPFTIDELAAKIKGVLEKG